MTDNQPEIKLTLPKDLLKELTNRFNQLTIFLEENGLNELTFDDYERVFTKSGWFLPFDMSMKDVFTLTKLLKSDDTIKADKILVNYYKSNLGKIKNQLLTKYPERDKIIKEAFKCHKRKLYHASIILFISQADGIAGGNIFMGSHLRNIRKQNPDHYLLKIFHKENPITSYFGHKEQLDDSVDNLSRHGVMHGTSLNYGIRLNSFKAISLLACMSDFRHRINE